MSWNAGGWYGGQVGATAWMLVAGILTAIRDAPLGMLIILLFAVPNGVGIALWCTRRLSCFASNQVLIAVAGACGMLTVYSLESNNAWLQMQTGSQVSAQSSYWILGLVYGGLLLMFQVRFGRAGTRNDSPS